MRRVVEGMHSKADIVTSCQTSPWDSTGCLGFQGSKRVATANWHGISRTTLRDKVGYCDLISQDHMIDQRQFGSLVGQTNH